MVFKNDTMIEEEARKRFPVNHIVDDPFGATGEAWSDEYGYDECARNAFIAGAKWATGSEHE